MQQRTLISFAVLSLAAAVPAQSQQMAAPRPAQTRNVTLTGEVIDLSCRLGQGLAGDQHRMCAEVCADRGIPLAILGSDGNVYLPISHEMPGSGQNARLKPFAEQRVRVTGQVVNQNGARAIFIDTIARAS
ncbi:MAG: hypothetical protein A2085_08900 [Gemmatimonadetes bacterium GWC2_71_10]|nr:MAG: hypothetical protein A2085_08900 [Gemmatimonadetes bacterium GWC2_71_10]